MSQYSKYKLYYKEEYDGEQWTPVIPYQYYGEMIEEYSTDCGWTDCSGDYLTLIARESGTFKFTSRSSTYNYRISYSTDSGSTWSTPTTDNITLNVNSGDIVKWKGTMRPSTSGTGVFSESTASFDVEGNAMSLIYNDIFVGRTDILGKAYAFTDLFKGTKVVNAEKLVLPATTLEVRCYLGMFSGCTSLVAPPIILPAKRLEASCYRNMFQGCTSLTKAPKIQAERVASQCCWEMFEGCTSLTKAPELPATDFTYNYPYNCYNSMFANCTSLVKAPSILPATTLEGDCYCAMFSGCTSLTTSPELPATSLKGRCYQSMFEGCTNLNYIKAMFTTTPSNDFTLNWVNGVAGSGTFVKNNAATWNPEDVRGVNGIPIGWTVQDA